MTLLTLPVSLSLAYGMAGNKTLVAQLTTTFSRQRQRRSTPVLPLALHARYIQTSPPTTSAAAAAAAAAAKSESFYEDGYTPVEPSVSFLEPESEEYRRVVLPARERTPFTAAWPTILAHGHPSSEPIPHPPHAPVTYLARSTPMKTTTTRTRTRTNKTPCQAVHQLIRIDKDLASAHRLIDELTQLGTPILPHRAYLDAAIYQARRRGIHSQIKTDTMTWLRRWHAFPPTKQFRHVHLAALEPLLEIVIERWPTDFQFLKELMLLAAERGWAPALVPVLFRHYTICVGPVESLQLLNEMAAFYSTKTPDLAAATVRLPVQREGETVTAEQQLRERRARNVVAQVTKWRNLHLRTVLQGDEFVEEAKMIFQAGEEAGVVWDRATKSALVEALQARLKQLPQEQPQNTLSEEETPVSSDETMMAPTPSAPTAPLNGLALPQQTIRIAHARSRQPVRHLVDLLSTLEQKGRYTLISRLEKRFIRLPFSTNTSTWTRTGSSLTRNANETTAVFWWMAHIMRMRGQGRHVDALKVFRDRFYAVGLPFEGIRLPLTSSVGAADDNVDDADADIVTTTKPTRRINSRKLYPSREIIAAVLPSLIHLVNPTTPHALAALHTEFLHSLSSIGTRTSGTADPVLHLPFILFCARNFGAKAAEEWCSRLEERQGCKVGVQGWSVVAVEYAKTRKMADIHGILDRMQQRSDGPVSISPETAAVDGVQQPGQWVRTGVSSEPNERTFMGIATALLKRKKYYKAKAVLQRRHEEQERRRKDAAAALVVSTSAAAQDLE
ncbi:hypothetical protein QFC24_003171 [Naganishia onofrii]|uniref:Uncharacterized protein n=1 Tax=Naganishia onofrii TaxID=1851511 RepID=A0ACC2XQ29_9TREE|nr:hypothetical protein QFC24_003171 [Naganishia onofrii]